MTLAVIPGPKKPFDLMSFLSPIYEEITQLNERGLKVVKNGEEILNGKVYLMCNTGDMPGVADLMNHMHHNGEYGCRFCPGKGKYEGSMCHINFATIRSLEVLKSGVAVSH